ncbi:MAG: polysaccharide deacetylase family protein [Burkholderiaceae bacterium]|nr:polysaccharide deacetylase family protein [Burkholderiaceae bacterium]
MNPLDSVPAVQDNGYAMSVTLHDVAPATQARCAALIAALERIAPLDFTLLVVPYYHGRTADAAFQQWLQSRLQRGDELVLHGLTHRDEGPAPRRWLERVRRQWYTDDEGEFASLDSTEATRRLKAGRRWFARRDWPLSGFVAPAWLLSEGTWHALLRQPFDYTCTRTSLFALPHGMADRPVRVLHARSIVYSTRAAWRRAVSRPWNALVAYEERRRGWMRFELHPSDFEYRAVREQALRLVADAVDEGREPLTLGSIAERLHESASIVS